MKSLLITLSLITGCILTQETKAATFYVVYPNGDKYPAYTLASCQQIAEQVGGMCVAE